MRDPLLERLRQQLSDIPVPDPGEGWERMKEMLEETDRAAGPVLIRWWQVAAFLAVMAGGAGLLYFHLGSAHKPGPLAAVRVWPRTTAHDQATGDNPPGLAVPAPRPPGPVFITSTPSVPMSPAGAVASPGLTLAPAGPAPDLRLLPGTAPRPLSPLPSIPRRSPYRGHSHWLFDIGLGADLRGSFSRLPGSPGQSSLRAGLYPVARITYRVDNRWSLVSGLSVPAPVSFRNPAADASATDDSLLAAKGLSGARRVSRILYVNVPLEAGYEVFKGLSVTAGVQASLVTAKDFYGPPYYGGQAAVAASPQSFSPGYFNNAVSDRGKLTNPAVRKADWRSVFGILYRLGRFGADLQFQHGLDHSALEAGEKGDVFTTRTNVVCMNLTYQVY